MITRTPTGSSSGSGTEGRGGGSCSGGMSEASLVVLNPLPPLMAGTVPGTASAIHKNIIVSLGVLTFMLKYNVYTFGKTDHIAWSYNVMMFEFTSSYKYLKVV